MKIKELHRSEKSIVTLMIDPDTGVRYVRKELRGPHPVYERLKSLPHPYLPKIVQAEQTAAGTLLLEEYIEGANLSEIHLPERQILPLMEELCEVLVFLHQHGIIHRDIKPSNLLLAPDGHIRLIDFDAAREERPGGENDTRLLGTRGYAPPEQYGFSQTDARADIYSVGVTLKHLLGNRAEKRPYRHIIRKCTEFAPKRRYATAKALLWALKTRAVLFLMPWLLLAALLVSGGIAVWWYQSNIAEITEAHYPDEPLLFYTTSGDYLIANAGELRQNGQQLTMLVDMDGDKNRETITLNALGGQLYGEFGTGTPVENGEYDTYTGMNLLAWMAYDVPIEEYLSYEPGAFDETPPDNYYVQITCVDLNPSDHDGKEFVVSVGDLAHESVSAVYRYVGTIDTPASYCGKMWGGPNLKLDHNGTMESELEANPYQAQNWYYYFSDGVQVGSEADYELYREAVNGELSLEEWHNAFAAW